MPERPEYPDDIAFIARLRGEGVPEKVIAERMGVCPKTLWSRVSTWNKRNPDSPLPRPASRPETPFYIQAAKLRLEQGLTDRQIAARMGKSLLTVHVYLTKARAEGVLPPREGNRLKGGMATWSHYRAKGATIPLGTVGTIVDHLDAEHVEALLRRIERNDPTIADTLARIVKEHLDAEQAQE